MTELSLDFLETDSPGKDSRSGHPDGMPAAWPPVRRLPRSQPQLESKNRTFHK
jgi:hypothetical protein